MPRQGELSYYQAIGEEGRQHAMDKPFSDPERGLVLMQVGAILTLIPPPPLRILDCGCGTGWLSWILKKSGYDVVGIDVSPQAIDLARTCPAFAAAERPAFAVGDAESMSFADEFDVVLFYDALHHTLDEEAALRGAYRALRPGGMCVLSEPGVGHGRKSRDVVARFDVTEKDMPPRHVMRLARRVGFTRQVAYPRSDDIGKSLFASLSFGPSWLSPVTRSWAPRFLVLLGFVARTKSKGTTVLYK
jgi:SAM-dependent methyltransferase